MADLSRRTLLACGAGAAVVALSGCTRDRPLITEQTPAGQAVGEIGALHEILARRASAVPAGDEALFLSDLDQSNAALIGRQRLLFANLRQFSWTTFGYVIPPDVQPAPQGDDRWRCPVVGTVQLSIDDTGTGVLPGETFLYTLARKDGRVVVADIVAKTAGDAATAGIDGPAADAPWHSTALRLAKVGQVWLAADASVTDLDRYIGLAGGQVQRIQALWGERLRYPGCLLFLTRDSEAFKTWYGFGKASNYADTVEGVAPHRLGVRTNGQPYRDQYAAARAVVNLKRVDTFGDDPAMVIRHELAHAITARAVQVGSGFADLYSAAPAWAVEGFAAYTETLDNPGRAQQYRAAANTGLDGRLPRSADFYTTNVGAHYAQGAAAFLYAQQLKGVDAAVELYASTVKYADLGGEPVAELPAFDGVCRRVLGISAPAFTTGWANYVRSGR